MGATRTRGRAVFLDRDGVLNDLEYDKEEGRIGGPLSADRLKVFPYAGESVRRIKELGFMVILVSNQPGVAKQQFTRSELEKMKMKVRNELARRGGSLDAEYYCLHHPDARVKRYRLDCKCRKPKPGLLLQAASENDLDISNSFFVGDALVDVKAGKAAGCKTILLGHPTTFLSSLVEKEKAAPDFILPSLKQVPVLLQSIQQPKAGNRAKAKPNRSR